MRRQTHLHQFGHGPANSSWHRMVSFLPRTVYHHWFEICAPAFLMKVISLSFTLLLIYTSFHRLDLLTMVRAEYFYTVQARTEIPNQYVQSLLRVTFLWGYYRVGNFRMMRWEYRPVEKVPEKLLRRYTSTSM